MKEVIKTTLKGMPYVAGVAAFIGLGSIYPQVMAIAMATGIVLIMCYLVGSIASIPKGNRVR